MPACHLTVTGGTLNPDRVSTMDHVWVPKRDPAFKKLQSESKKKIKLIETSSCVPHALVFNSGRFKAHYRCTKCGGIMDTVCGQAYMLGLEHGLNAAQAQRS